MAEKAKKDNKNLIIGICCAVAVVVVVIVAVVLATSGSSKLSDAYFVSDNTKYVLTMEGDDLDTEDEEYTIVKTHIVYNYSGDKITGMSTYAEYADEATAKKAYEIYKSADQDGIKKLYVDGKYVVAEMEEDQYADLTVDSVKSQIEFMEMIKNMDLDNYDYDEDEE